MENKDSHEIPNHINFVAKRILERSKVRLKIVLHASESFPVRGVTPHSIWNNADSECVMIGITIKPK